MNKFINKYNMENEKYPRSLNSKNPREYWKILDKFKKKSTVELPDLQELYNHFKYFK